MQAEDEQTAMSQSAPSHDSAPQEWLTDVIDQLDRRAFQRALERRHAAPSYRTVIEEAQLVATPPLTS
jgi:hypothetical protein